MIECPLFSAVVAFVDSLIVYSLQLSVYFIVVVCLNLTYAVLCYTGGSYAR